MSAQLGSIKFLILVSRNLMFYNVPTFPVNIYEWALQFCSQDLTNGKDTMIPVFDFHLKKRVSSKVIKSASSGVVSGDYFSLCDVLIILD